MLSTRRIRAAVLCSVLATGAAACGGAKGAPEQAAPASATASVSHIPEIDTLTPSQVEEQSLAAMSSLDSVRIAGNVTADGKKTTIDLTIDKAQDCSGTMTIGGLGTVQLLHNAAGTWMQPDTAFWQNISAQQGHAENGPKLAEMFKDRYLTGGQDDSNMKKIASMCGLFKSITSNSSTDDNPTKVGPATIDGIATEGFKTSDSTVYIAAEVPFRIIRMESTGTNPGQIDFTNFNAPLVVQAPPADEVVDYSTFQQKLTSI